MKRLPIALVTALMVCAIASLRQAVLRAEMPEAGGAIGEQMSGVNGDIRWTMFDETQAAKITLVAYDTTVVSGGAGLYEPEARELPPVDGSVAFGNSAKSNDDADAGKISSARTEQGDDPVASLNENSAPVAALDADGLSRFRDRPIVYNLLSDERYFYRCASLEWLALGIGTSAVLANTHADQGFRDAYGESLRPADRDLDFLKEFGNGVYVIPALAAIWTIDFGIDSYSDDDPCGGCVWLQEWSGRSMRGLIVGAAPLLSLQYLIGSSRPSAGTGSQWEPFKSSHGVSGHAFVGAVPLWTAAQMTDCCALEAGFYTAGTLAGWSRIHTDAHYFSQVLLGWWLAGLSVSAVNHTELGKHDWYVMPTLDEGGTGISLIHLH